MSSLASGPLTTSADVSRPRRTAGDVSTPPSGFRSPPRPRRSSRCLGRRGWGGPLCRPSGEEEGRLFDRRVGPGLSLRPSPPRPHFFFGTCFVTGTRFCSLYEQGEINTNNNPLYFGSRRRRGAGGRSGSEERRRWKGKAGVEKGPVSERRLCVSSLLKSEFPFLY